MEYPFYCMRNNLNGLLKRQLSIIKLTKDGIEVLLEETLRGVRLLDSLYDVWPKLGSHVPRSGMAQQLEKVFDVGNHHRGEVVDPHLPSLKLPYLFFYQTWRLGKTIKQPLNPIYSLGLIQFS